MDGQSQTTQNFPFEPAYDGPISVFLPCLGWFEALLSLFFLCVVTLVGLQVAMPWALRLCLCFSSPDDNEDH
jgi:hypothetical protein